ncbi:MAG: hypothetical protein KDA41_08430, partial [Planctomycetales bacterium]|nr:hypothetical protein [Planctomycetales bacterium]
MGRQVQAAVLAAMTVAGLLLAVRWALAESNFAMGLGGFVGVLSAVAWWHAACRGLLTPTPVASFLMLAQATAWGAALTLAAPGPLSLAPLLLLGGIEAVWRLTSSHGDAAHLAAGEASEATSDGSHAAAAAEENSLFVAQATDAPSRDWRDGEAETLDEHWTQIQTRGGDGDSEYIRVQQRVAISAGQRLAVFHVGFCPPLA